jgi:predicted nucleotidyltransferase component of viral defense system
VTHGYPIVFGELSAWAEANRVTVAEARVRFAQYAVLRAIASVGVLRAELVFKGGNALDFVWMPNRSTADLDFSLDHTAGARPFNPQMLRELIERGLQTAQRSIGVTLALYGVRQHPHGEARTFATFDVRVGYALPDEQRLQLRMRHGQTSPHIVRVEISQNEPICAATIAAVDATHTVRVCTLEDIVAEKLRALLQQPIRNRERKQDLLDIAVTLRHRPNLDRAAVSNYLLEKAAARNVPVSRVAFRNPEIERRARVDYEAMEATTRTLFVPFDEAWASLLAFVDELAIPEDGVEMVPE